MQNLFLIMRTLKVFVLLSCVVLNLPAANAQQTSRRLRPTSRPVMVGRNPQIAQIVREIDARNIERSIRTLVSFGTRNTLSSQSDPNRGIGAARDWLYREFTATAAQSGGRMTVEKQTFEQPKAERIPTPTMITNVVATLRGTRPESEGPDLHRQRPLRFHVHQPHGRGMRRARSKR